MGVFLFFLFFDLTLAVKNDVIYSNCLSDSLDFLLLFEVSIFVPKN